MKKYLALFTALILTCISTVLANSKNIDSHDIVVPQAMDDWSWTNAPWEASDATYLAIRQQIEGQLATGKSRSELIQKTQEAFSQNQNSPTLAFSWAYAFYGDQRFDAPHDKELARKVYFSLVSAIKGKPVSYEYARMEFLVASSRVAQKALIGLGNRLLAHSPDDENVKFNLAALLAYGNSDQKQNAKKYARYFLKKYPESYGAHALWAVIYLVDSNFGTGNKALGDRAITESQAAKSYLPDDKKYDDQRARMDSLVTMITNNRKNAS